MSDIIIAHEEIERAFPSRAKRAEHDPMLSANHF